MKRVATVLVLAAVTAGAATASPAPPRLVLVGKHPLVLRGTHFRGREWVRLTAFADGQIVKRVRASRKGNFVATLPTIAYGRCGGGFGIRAVGSLGSRATFGVKVPLTACMPASSPARSP